MGYQQFLRNVDARQTRDERATLRRHRDLLRHMQQVEKWEEKQRAADEVAVYENYLQVLVSVHKDCGGTWNWQAEANATPPAPPIRRSDHENRAQQDIVLYKPGLFERWFGKEKTRRQELQDALEFAKNDDERAFEAAMLAHRAELSLNDERRSFAERVLARDVNAFRRALERSDAYYELAAFKTRVGATIIEPDVIVLECFLEDEELVPREELKLTASGKVSKKEMPASRYWSLHQDYVCSCAIRAARETFAVLPVSRVIVNVKASRLDTSIGHHRDVTLLAVQFVRGDLARLNLEAIDPSDSLKNFHHRMKFKKTAGFEYVEPMAPDENWVQT